MAHWQAPGATAAAAADDTPVGAFFTKHNHHRRGKDRRRWFELHGFGLRYFASMDIVNGVCNGVGWKGEGWWF